MRAKVLKHCNTEHPALQGLKVIRCKTIPKPVEGTRAVLQPTFTGPAMKGLDGDVNYICGKCELVLLENIAEGQVTNMVIHCNNCLSYNEVS